MKEIGASLAIATDGDADRFGIVDGDGTFIQPNYVIALLFDYLVETRGWKNGVAKSVATTNLINALADYYKVPLYETPVGFKYIGELIIADKIAIGGEESAGLTIRGHVPEKDGIIAGLLVAEMVATRGTSLGAQLKALFAKVGSFYPVRENFHLTAEQKAAFTEKLKADPRELGGRKVVKRSPDRRAEADSRRWLVGLLPAFGHRTGGTRLYRGAQTRTRCKPCARRPKDLFSADQFCSEWIEVRCRKKTRNRKPRRGQRPRSARSLRRLRDARSDLGATAVAAGRNRDRRGAGAAGHLACDLRQARRIRVAAETRRRPRSAAGDQRPAAGKRSRCASRSSGCSRIPRKLSARRGKNCITPSPAK